MSSNNLDWMDDEQKIKYKLLEAKVKREIRLEQERKRKAKREMFDMIFPELEGMPIAWIVIGVICILFSMVTMII